MITITTASPPTLDLEARLALIDATMTLRLEQAALAFAVNTAHIPAIDHLPEITAPLQPSPLAVPCPYRTPIAATLHRARIRMESDGWCAGQLRDEQGAACLIGVIRAEAGSGYEASDAGAVLLEAIRRDFADAETIPSWNDAQRDPRLPLLYLDRAAALAHARGL